MMLLVVNLERRERRLERFTGLVPYLALGVSTLGTWLFAADVSSGSFLLTLLLSVLAGGWIFFMVTLHPRWEERRVLMVVYYVGLIAFIAVLVARSPVYGFFAFTGYLHAAHALRGGWRLVGAVATAACSAVSQVGGLVTLSSTGGILAYLAVFAFNAALACGMTMLAAVITEQSDRRKRMIAELAEANDKLAAAMAENAGLHAQLLAQAREAGVLDERHRMAREIHDTLAQGLIGIITQLEAATLAREAAVDRDTPGLVRPRPALVGAPVSTVVEPAGRVGAAGPASAPDGPASGVDGPDPGNRHIETAMRLARESLSEARRSVRALRPEPLEDAQLPEALAEVTSVWSRTNGVAAELTTTGRPVALLPEIEVTLLRTAQEALANVAKHAAARRVGLTLSYMEDLVTLDVRDDGRGFDPDGARDSTHDAGGFGLIAMRERVSRIAGSLAIESEPGAGTAISATVPALPAGGVA